jgi:hypothetical protein
MDGIVDFVKSFNLMGDISFDWPFAQSSFVDQFRDIIYGFPSTKSGTDPLSSSDQLERSGGNLFSSLSNTNDTGLSKASVGSFQGFSHDCNISSTIVSVPNTPFFLFKKPGFCTFFRSWFVANIGSKLFSDLKLLIVNVNGVDFSSALDFGGLNYSKSDSTQSPDSNSGSRLNSCIIHGGTPTC